ncbi:MAG: type II secretion system F family protein [Candidatus Korobacteraceae bacterium]|jgi:tight adherence protein C
MIFAILAFVAVFVLIGSIGVLMFYREAALDRISQVINPRRAKQKTLVETFQNTGSSIGNVVKKFENLMPKSEKEVSVIKIRMQRAGFRGENAIKIFYGCKVLLPLTLAAIAAVSGLADMGPFFVYLLALGGGFLAPDFWLGKRIEKRQKKLTRGLPDVLDLLVICMEAGLSLDQATARSAEELRSSQPEICDELAVVVLEQRAGRARSEAWKTMSERTGVECLRNLVSMLVQTEQFGTSIAKMLRVHSDTLRVQRVQMVEEMAAKTSVKLVFPLVLFIFPALFLVTLGPAAIMMADSFKSLTK